MIFGDIKLENWMDSPVLKNKTAAQISTFITNYTATNVDEAFNYVAGTLLVAIFLISTTLNPYLIYLNMKKKPSLPTKLFIMLETVDFLTNIQVPISVAVLAFSPDLVPLYDFNVAWYTAGFSFFYLVCGNLTGAIASALAICRYLSIAKPFLQIRKRFIFGAILLFSVICSIIYYWFTWGFNVPRLHVTKLRSCQLVFYLGIKDFKLVNRIRLIISSVGILPGFLASLLTAVYLIRSTGVNDKSDSKKKQGALIIILMNIGNMLFIVTGVLNLVFILKNQYIIFLSSVVTPTILSAFNPVIFVITTSRPKQQSRSANLTQKSDFSS